MSSQQNKLKEKRRKKVFLLLFHFLLKTFDNFLQQKILQNIFWSDFDTLFVLINLTKLAFCLIYSFWIVSFFASSWWEDSSPRPITQWLPMWPDLVKFCHLIEKNIKVFVNFWEFIWFLEKFQTSFGKFWSFWIDFHCYK